MSSDYYVYVYIDPIDYSEFYYGKGRGDRKNAHLSDDSDSDKTRIIKEIVDSGLDPIIRVVARDLTESEAFLIEKTLIWKLGKTLSNKSSGMFADKFRPKKTLYKELFGFDFKNGVFFFNCGDNGKNQRKWEDFKDHGFLTAGGGKTYSDAIRTFEVGDIACVYLSTKGYVGVGRIRSKAIIVDDFRINGRSVFELVLSGSYERTIDRPEDSEYMCQIEWIRAVDRKAPALPGTSWEIC